MRDSSVLKYLFGLLAASLLAVSDVPSCTCGGGGDSVKEALPNYEAVFLGQVIGLKFIGPLEPTFGAGMSTSASTEAKFRVISVWKGVTSLEVVVQTASSDAACGFPFVFKKRFLVFAHRLKNGQLGTSLCSPTSAFSAAADKIADLGEPLYPKK